MRQALTSIRFLILCTLTLGLVYPVLMIGIGQMLAPYRSNGSLIRQGDAVRGSELLAQKFTEKKYFWPRPSATDYQTLGAGASHLSPISRALKVEADARELKLIESHGLSKVADIPDELLFASGSGLDPHVSLESILFQLDRVISARSFNEKEQGQLFDLIRRLTENRQFGFLGKQRVNVLQLNLGLDQIKG